MFERFTERTRRVVVAAQEEARMLGHNHIGSEHLLLGLLHEQGGTAAQVLESAGVTAEAARSQVDELAGPGDKSPSGHIPFTQRAKKILELSLREALEQKKSYIGTEHILLALMRDSGGMGAQVLERLGGSLSALRQRVLEAAKAAAPDPDAEREAEQKMWAADWRHAQGYAREARVSPQTVVGFRQLLAPIDRRLANIERHLGITADEEAGEAGEEGQAPAE
jgi:ATP-dependent Clp protease ATP-binding subunit ClpC